MVATPKKMIFDTGKTARRKGRRPGDRLWRERWHRTTVDKEKPKLDRRPVDSVDGSCYEDEGANKMSNATAARERRTPGSWESGRVKGRRRGVSRREGGKESQAIGGRGKARRGEADDRKVSKATRLESQWRAVTDGLAWIDGDLYEYT